MAQDIATENFKVDFRYFITSALQNKINWEVLDYFLNDLTPNLATSKKVIKVLLNELQKLQSKLQRVNNEDQSVQDQDQSVQDQSVQDQSVQD